MSQSISATKSRLSEEIERLHHPIVVFIDNLDRLEAKELFEVLRIIRNTISFQNLYYIVAYDKNYALQTLEQQGIAEAEHYFEKIFQVEIPLPNPSIYSLFDMFRKDVNSMFSEKDLMNKGIKKVSAKDIMQVVSVLPNYREIHRLVRLYVIELDIFQQQCIKVTDYNPTDLLWLTIVMLYDYNTYVKLHDDPAQYVIYKRCQSNSNVWLLSLRSGINPDDRQDSENKESYKGNKLRKSTAKALVNLFQKAHILRKACQKAENWLIIFHIFFDILTLPAPTSKVD